MPQEQSTLMVNLSCNGDDADLLAITGALALQMNAAVIGAAVYELATDVAVTVAGMGGLSSPQQLIDDEREHAEKRIAKAKAAFFEALNGKADPLEWRSKVTHASATDWLAKNARAADIVITHPFADGSYASMYRRANPGDLIMNLGRPELLLPRGLKSLDLSTVLVAWRDSRESRLAISSALPLLRLAGRVIVAEIVPPGAAPKAQSNVDDVCQWLRRKAIKAEGHVEIANATDAQEIAALIGSSACGLIVAGAYGHSRMREWTLGGVTHDLLLHPRCATLIAH
ncbi:nucleotide-binding universal stress UspA family protein [Rhizomicrobium palustre]|uniref:Nucleotide-binding universal stress UspA family protein n=1 Tax=Rhizomicrobium palustre TaxID=189966 RepID=A0A846MUJ1_9PROT|nr:universal stress protein [Rhizomicrobium palustre]NIK87104.1 nucleotide-binding universal stress UspA family protein [Rhizomicrobium palustre]